jgi:hypothetical protein
MATGNVINWSGASGWIKQSGVGDLPTSEANDCIFRAEDVVSGQVVLGAAVSFTTTNATPWLAENVTVL